VEIFDVRFQVADEQRRLTGHGYDARFVLVQDQLELVRGRWLVVDIQTEEDRAMKIHFATPARIPLTDDGAIWCDESNDP
jgi:hypothetical protein